MTPDQGPRRRLAIMVLALVAVAGGVLVLALGGARPDRPDSVSEHAESRTSIARTTVAPLAVDPAAPPREEGLGFLTGDVLSYRFTNRQTVRLTAAGAGPLPGKTAVPPVALAGSLDGEFELTVYATDATGWSVGLRATSVRTEVEAEQGEAIGDPATYAEQMRHEVLAHIDRRGSLGKLIFDARVTASIRAVWKGLLQHWQLVLPEDAAETAWERVESDGTGVFRARYERHSAPDEAPVHIVKTKLAYDEVIAQGGIAFPCESTVTGQTEYVLDPLPRRIEGRQELSLDAADLGRKVEMTHRFAFVRTAHERRTLDGRDRASRLALEAGTFLNEREDDALVPAVGKEHAKARLGELARLFAEGKAGSAGEHRVCVALIRLLRRSPEAVELTLARLADASCDSKEATALAACLGAAATKECQRGLLRILGNEPRLERFRTAALFAMAQLTDPIEAFDAELQRLHDSRGPQSRNALLVLAAIGGKVRDRESGRFEAIQRRVLSTLVGAAGVEETTLALRAVANLGSRDVPEQVRRSLVAEDPVLRGTAAYALLRVPDPAADGLLLRMLREDGTAWVRRRALDVLVRRHRHGHGRAEDLEKPILETIADVARLDPDEKLREHARKLQRRARADASR